MDNSTGMSSSEPYIPSLNTNSISSSSITESSGILDTLKNMGAVTWFLIILILAFLGFNIFSYLAEGTQEVTDFLKPLTDKIFGTAAVVTSDTINVAAEGAKAVVGGTAAVATSGLNAVQDVAPNAATIKAQAIEENVPPSSIVADSTLNKALDSAQPSGGEDYEPQEASSSVHSSAGKAGWCYVGNDRGFRTCAEVGVNDKCMSGDIFPSQQICVNPNLRA
jgi:hypothetical protein